MDGRNLNVVDVSSYLLVEATGDSEVDCDPDLGDVAENEDDGDDAQSCCCNCTHIARLDEFDGTDDDQGYVYVDHGIDVHDEEEEEEEDVVDQRVGMAARARQPKKSRACSDSTREKMSEVEKNRLFWEACLAS